MDTSSEDEIPVFPPLNNNTPIPAQNAQESNRKQQLAVHLILASILFQITAYVSLDSSLKETLNYNGTLNWTEENSSNVVHIFEGIEFFLMFLFAVINDAKVSRIKMIIMGFPFYLIGFTLMTMISMESSPICSDNGTDFKERRLHEEKCHIPVFISLILTAIGAAAIRPILIVFGAEQIQQLNFETRYFDKLVVIVNLSAIIQTLMDSHIAQPEPGKHYFTYFIVANIMLVVSIFLFFLGYRIYYHTQPYDSALLNCLPVVRNAFHTWYEYRKTKSRYQQRITDTESMNLSDRHSVSFLDFAKVTNNGKFQDRFVDDVKLLRNAFILFLLLFPYRLIYSQFYTLFPDQASFMKHTEDQTVVHILISEPVTIIGVIVIFNIFAYKYRAVRNRLLTIGNKFIISMVFSVITMCIASGVEAARQHECPYDISAKNISNLSIYYQLPQDIGMGFAQSFATLAILEFSFFIAPRSARSFFMTLQLFSAAVASYIQRVYTTAFHEQLKFDCPIDGHNWSYLYFFLILSAIQFIFMIIFIISTKKTQILKLDPQKFEKTPIQRTFNTSIT